MRVTPPGSLRRPTAKSILDSRRGSISDGEIQDSPPRARSPTLMPPIPMDTEIAISPPRSRRSRSSDARSDDWYHSRYSSALRREKYHSIAYYPTSRGQSSPPAPREHFHSMPRDAPRAPSKESGRSESPGDSSSCVPPPYWMESDESEADSTSLDAAVASQGPGLPEEPYISFNDLMARLVRSLDIEAYQQPGPSTDRFYDVVRGERSTSNALPFITTLWQAMTQPWDLPAHPQPTSRKYEPMYRREEDIPFLLRHPKPNSVVVESSQGQEARGHTSPRDKEGRKVDSLARRVYAASGLGLRISNYEATLARYQYFLMQRLDAIIDTLPGNQGELAKTFVKEAMQVAVQQLSTARHHVDSDLRSLVGHISLRRHAWLRNCNFPDEMKRRIEELPFDGSGLFHARTDSKLKKIDESRMTAHRMELQSLPRRAIRRLSLSEGLHGFYSRYFTVPKRDGGLRPILDLRALNRFITPKKFRMATLQSILPLLGRGDWFASLDLKDAYFHISIHPSYRHFLHFAVDSEIYEFNVLPFGLATAPVCAHLRLRGIRIYPYLDDWLLVSDTEAGLSSAVEFTCALLHDLGLCINQQKSSLLPTQVINFIGARLDLTLARAFLPRDGRHAIAQCIARIRQARTVPARSIQSLLGNMSASIAVVPHAKLRLRPLQLFFNGMFRPQTDPPTKWIRLPASILQSLLWWIDPANLTVGIPFRPWYPAVTLGTDASLLGWGAICSDVCTQGIWSHQDCRNHINFLELLAVFKALQSFEDVLLHQVVQVTSDNMAMVFYLNKQGGTRSRKLAHLAMQIWDWCIPRGITLLAVHLAGTENTDTDLLSRHMSRSHKWELDHRVHDMLFHRWGQPDLFATQQNRACMACCSRAGMGQDSLEDAFMIPWTNMTFYAFPPIPLIMRVLAKIIHEGATGLLITPWWPHQPWFSTLLHVSQEEFLQLPLLPYLVTQREGTIRHPDLLSLKLAAWRIQ
ncbi:Transposon Ty3-I Gag-Pol polyprotein [Varanus komodoensis]|nr:Transposon Ty3-I Gag-Pol polyprotein [Varanus komodoensis]